MGGYIEYENGEKELQTFATREEAEAAMRKLEGQPGIKQTTVYGPQNVGDVVTMRDGTRYEVRADGWRRVK